MNVVNVATNKKGWTKSSISFNHGAKKISFTVYHDMVTEGGINSINAAAENWYLRTRRYNQHSFIEYVNSKGLNTVLREDEFEKLK